MTLNSEGLEKAVAAYNTRQDPAQYGATAQDYGMQEQARQHVQISAAVTAYLSALPPVDGLEVVAHAYVVEGECEQIEWGSDVLLPDDPSLVELTPLSQASSVIAGLKEANEALMRERTSLIETKREQIERLTKERDDARAYASKSTTAKLEGANATLLSRISSLEEEKQYWWEKAHEENGLRVHLEEENKRLQRKLDLLETTVSFTRRWAIEKDGNGTSAEERLSAIANHPGVKGIQIGDHNG